MSESELENLEENNCDVRNGLIRKSRNEIFELFGKIISIIVVRNLTI